MPKTAWGATLHDMPQLSEICRLSTAKEVVEYMLDNELIEDQRGKRCDKLQKYPRSSKTKQCSGVFNLEGPHLNNMYWRCNKGDCRQRNSIFAGTLLDQLNIPLPDLFQTLYLSMLNIPVSMCISLCTEVSG